MPCSELTYNQLILYNFFDIIWLVFILELSKNRPFSYTPLP